MSDCKQTRLRAVVLVDCFIKLSKLSSLVFSMHKKVPMSKRAVTQVCAEFDVVRFFITLK